MRNTLRAALVLAATCATPAFAQSPIQGTWRMVSFILEVEGQPAVESMGKAPRGMVIFTPTHVASITTAETRKFGTSVDDKAKLWDTLIAYGGRYRVEGDRIVASVDVSWNESWNGTEVSRTFVREGNRLRISTAKAPYSRDPSRMAQAHVILEKVD